MMSSHRSFVPDLPQDMVSAIVSQLFEQASPEATDALLVAEQLNHLWKRCTAGKWEKYAKLRWASLPPIRDFKHFYLKRQYIDESVHQRTPLTPDWRKGVYLVVEIHAGEHVFNQSL